MVSRRVYAFQTGTCYDFPRLCNDSGRFSQIVSFERFINLTRLAEIWRGSRDSALVNTMIQYTCPVCAFSRMPYAADEGNICPCCGTEFGFDDTMGITFRQLRDRWVAANTPWFSPVNSPPPLWNGVVQLILSEYEFTWPAGRTMATRQPIHMLGTHVNARLQRVA